jgi:hypothetical protein
MPLDKSMSHEDMVSELITGYKKTGKIGATKPRDMKHALEIANAVAYNIEESNDVKKIYKEVKEMKIEDLLKSLEETISAKEKELGIVNEVKPSVKVEFDNGETIETEVADNATDEEIKNYYAKGKEFNLGQGGRDRLTKVKNVSVTRNVTESHTNFKDLANTYGIDYETFNKNHKFNDYDEIPEEWEEYIEDSNSTFAFVVELFKDKGYFVERINPDVIETGYITFKIVPSDWRKRNLKTGALEVSRADLVTKNGYEVAQEIANEVQDRYPNVFKSIAESLEFIPTEVEFADDKECLENATDVIALDVPLFLRLLEWAREDATEDVDLHVVAENAIKIMQNNTEYLSMEEYNDIIKFEETEIPEMDMGDMGADLIEPMKDEENAHFFTKDRLKTTPEDMERILKELEELS